MALGLMSVIVFAMASLLQAAEAESQEKDAVAYKKAYSLILEEKWLAGKKAMEEFVQQFQGSAWVDDARFWECYAGEKLNESREAVFNCYQEFVRAYPRSEWADDARANMIRIGKELVKAGRSEYEAVIRSMETDQDDEVKLLALLALYENGDKQALKSLLDLYDKTKKRDIKGPIVFVLHDLDTPEALAKLNEIALKESDSYVRKTAIQIIGERRKPESIKILKDIILSNADLEVRYTAAWVLGNIRDPEIFSFLADVAQNEANSSLARAAINSLVKSIKLTDAKEGYSAFIRILKENKNSDLRRDVFSTLIAQDLTPEISSQLKEIMLKEGNLEFARSALYSLDKIDLDFARSALSLLADNKSQESLDTLKKVLESRKEPELRKMILSAIVKRGGKEAEDYLLNIALNYSDKELAEAAGLALWSGNGKQKPSIEEFMEIIKKARAESVKIAAARIVAGRKDSVKELALILKNNKDPETRQIAAVTLGFTKSDEAVPVLLEAIKSGDTKLVQVAITALGRIGTTKAKAALKEIAERKE
jgi:HEAT repeat protein